MKEADKLFVCFVVLILSVFRFVSLFFVCFFYNDRINEHHGYDKRGDFPMPSLVPE